MLGNDTSFKKNNFYHHPPLSSYHISIFYCSKSVYFAVFISGILEIIKVLNIRIVALL
jgi:hypothetical protein